MIILGLTKLFLCFLMILEDNCVPLLHKCNYDQLNLLQNLMKIVYVYISFVSWGGVERIMIEKMNQLAHFRDFHVYAITYGQGNHPMPYELDSRVTHIDMNVGTYVKYQYSGLRRLWEGLCSSCRLYRHLKQQLSMIEPDVIVTTTAGELAFLSRLKGNASLVVESHGGYDCLFDYPEMTLGHRMDILHRRLLLKNADVIVSLTNNDTRRWRLEYPCVKSIPNIVHINPLGFFSNLSNKNIIFVGRFAVQKGIPELLEIWKKVHLRHPDWTLDMYGEKYEQYKDYMGEGICLHAPTDDIFSKYCRSSMLVLTSRWEPFGLVIPEAMSCGLPVISFEGDGPCEIINDGIDGYIIKDRNKDEFVSKVCQLIENVELRQQMGKNAIQNAQRYSADNIIPMWKELFESLKK